VVIGLGRNQLLGNAGDLSACVVRLTDSAGLMRVDLAVSATKSSTAGLWVGEAQVTQVMQYLKKFEVDPTGAPALGTNGAYKVLSSGEALGGVPKPFPMRLIIHDDGTNAVLLQRVFMSLDPQTNQIVATQQKFLDATKIGSARRISAAHLPWSAANTPWPVTLTSNVYRVQVSTPYDLNSVNPFVHQYHPDHDNLNASFTQVQPKGQESYGLTRTVLLSQKDIGSDYSSMTTGSLDRNGTYDETITVEGSGANTRTFRVLGTFNLNRISDISTLTR